MFAPAKFQGISTPQQESRNTTSILWTQSVRQWTRQHNASGYNNAARGMSYTKT